MPHSEVPGIELNQDDTINLYVNVDGFDVGTPIEISGQATQANGAVASFYDVQEMPPNSGQGAVLTVKSVPAVPPNKFVEGFPITVVARAAEVWITTLEPKTELAASAGVKAAWKSKNYNFAVRQSAQASSSAQAAQSWPTSTPAQLCHGTWWDRVKHDPLDAVMEGRFTRLFPDLPAARFDQADLEQLADEMTSQPERLVAENEDDPEENRGIPAAYTYLGQFADHDLTFDPTSQLRESLTREQLKALVDFRTPRFDLDNLYGRGPDDQPYMYEPDGIRMLLGRRMSGNPFDRGAAQPPRGPSGRALIGDPRDDENRIVAQLHAIFLRFHNQVADQLGQKNVSFQAVRQQVRWHYQWVLVTDFLPTILEEQTYESVLPDPHAPVLTIPGLQNGLNLMPVEFSVAAYRFGHSMVRSEYRLNTTIQRRPIFSPDIDDAADLGGMRPIPVDWAIDWQFFIDLEHGAEPASGDPGLDPIVRKPQLSYKIDTSLVSPLRNLPPQIAANPASLALRNLERGATFQLPSGQEVANALGVQPIADEELVIGKATANAPKKPIIQVARGFAGSAPLWTYILSEAQVTSWKNADAGLAKDDIPVKLGPVGGRIIAEVFAALLLGDPTSYLYASPAFAPIPAFTHNRRFGLAELINVALGRAP